MQKLTQIRLQSLLKYNPKTGEFYWRRSYKGSYFATAGSINRNGYRVICIDGVLYRAARLAWFYCSGEMPGLYVDHINRRRDDDRIANLRLATGSQNQANRGISRNNTSGVKGVGWDKKSRRWKARIMVDGSVYYLGSFQLIEDAERAYKEAALENFREFAVA